MGPDEIQLLSQLIQVNADNTNKKQDRATQQVMRNQTLRANQAESATNRQWKSDETQKARDAEAGLKALLLEFQDKDKARESEYKKWLTTHRDSTTSANQKWQGEQATDLKKFMLQFQAKVDADKRAYIEENRRYDQNYQTMLEQSMYDKLKVRTAEDYPLNTPAIRASLGQFLTEEGGAGGLGLNESDMMAGWNNMIMTDKLAPAINALKVLPADHPKKIELLSLLAEMQTKASTKDFRDGGFWSSGTEEKAVGDQLQLWIDTLTR